MNSSLIRRRQNRSNLVSAREVRCKTMASKALVLKGLQSVCGDELAKSVDAEVVSYVSDVIEFHKPGDDLSASVGAMLEDFIGEENTRKLIAFVEAEKGGPVVAAPGHSTLLSGPVGEPTAASSAPHSDVSSRAKPRSHEGLVCLASDEAALVSRGVVWRGQRWRGEHY